MITPSTASLQLPHVALEELVTRTNLSEVWRGRRRGSGEAVAVKFATSPAAAAALEAEAQTVAALQAALVPGIVPAEYAAAPVPHLMLPWKGGRTFRNVLTAIRTGDDRARATALLLQVAETAAAVQAEGFLHGDLKPENVLVDDAGRPWLTDFGMARTIHTARLDSEVSRSMSETDAGWGGTLHYLPPEGVQGEPPAPSWDVYALGVMLHEILLGRRPDRATTPESLRAALPPDVVDLLLGALAYAPADRYPTAPAFVHFFRPFARELTRTGPARLARRGARLAVAGLAAFFVALRAFSVLALLACYAVGIPLAMRQRGEFFLLYPAALLLHLVVRWEGPETPEEAALRRQGRVIASPDDG